MPTSPWFKLLAPLAGIVIALLVARLRGVSFRNDLGLRWPSLRDAAFWLGIWAALFVTGEFLIRTFGFADAEPWANREWSAVLLRAVPLILFGPALEELAFRGFLFFRLAPVAGPLAAIAILAVAWAALHFRYGWGACGLLVADGICLGLARWKSGSLWLPMAMHMLGNAVSVAQSLSR